MTEALLVALDLIKIYLLPGFTAEPVTELLIANGLAPARSSSVTSGKEAIVKPASLPSASQVGSGNQRDS